jgi:hypothetical protein
VTEFDLSEAMDRIRWRRIQAINNRGEVLLGHDEYGSRPGAMVIAPPGVLLKGPEGSDPITRRGWRLARWGPDGSGQVQVLVDQASPKALVEVGLAQVVEDLARWAPEHLIWVAEVVERNMRVQLGRMHRDCDGATAPGFDSAFDELTELYEEADRAFVRVRGLDGVPAWLTEGHFSAMRRAYLVTLEHDKAEFARAEREASRTGISR